MDGTLKQKRIVDPVLTNLARGYSNAELIGTEIFPVVPVKKEGGKVPMFTKEAFKIYNTERAIRANSNVISPAGKDSVDYVLTEHDLSYPIDYRELDEDILNLKMHATHVVTSGIHLRLEKQIADLIQNTSNYASTNKVSLTSGDGFNDSTSDPMSIIDDARDSLRKQIAKYPNVAVMSSDTFTALKNHPKVVDRIKYTQHAILTVELLRQLLGFEKLLVGQAIYEDDNGVLHDLFNDFMGLYYVAKGSTNVKRNYYEPSFGYTLKKNAYPFVDTYDKEGKVLYVRSTDLFQPKIVGADAGYLISNTIV